MTKKVEDWGSLDAKLILVGEAPGAKEEEQGKPFVGPSGYLMSQWWEEVGLVREDFYITNVYPFRPPQNKIDSVPEQEMEHWIEQLRERLLLLKNPHIIIPCGLTALKALTDKKSIHDWRGSILRYGTLEVNVIPVLHPAGVMRMKKFEGRCIADWRRIAYFKDRPGLIELPKRAHGIKPSISNCKEFLHAMKTISPVAIDIETHPAQGITCVGFAAFSHTSFTIPLGIRQVIETTKKRTKEEKEKQEEACNARISRAVHDKDLPLVAITKKKAEENAVNKWLEKRKPLKAIRKLVEEWEKEQQMPSETILIANWPDEAKNLITIGYWKTEEENEQAKGVIRQLCMLPNPKIMQFGFYDWRWLTHWLGADNVVNYDWDVAAMHHCLFPNDEHALDYLASLFTLEPFWKKEAKEAAESGKFATRGEALWTYNGKDVCVTRELFDVFYEMLKREGKLDFYDRHYRQMHGPLQDIMATGIQVDKKAWKERRQALSKRLTFKLEEFEAVTGCSIRGKMSISSQKVGDYLYRELRLGVVKRKRADGVKTESADEVAVRTLMLKHPEKLEKSGQIILDCKRLSKMISMMKDERLDEDGRYRSQFKFTTSTGRLASSSNAFGTGGNCQNIDREFRDLFIAGKEL